ncbi:hypothetical protein [Thermococcus sp. JCM 11816]|uniref:hypothetical protein n=1 Tax=Thermococcus sp. (strain JCM 11816 / KS-1) TaxID=1295125 RepID=UPI000AB69209
MLYRGIPISRGEQKSADESQVTRKVEIEFPPSFFGKKAHSDPIENGGGYYEGGVKHQE